MALKRLKVRMAAPAPTQETSDIPVIFIEGDQIKKYNDADAALKEADAEMKELRPEILEIAKTELFTRCCKRPQAPLTSIKLQDESGEILRVSYTARYGEVPDLDRAETLFDNHDIDINEYVTEGVKASFDDKVFYDADGNFLQEVYDDVRKAIQTIVTKRQLAKNPLETARVIKPKPKFHEDRYTLFPKVETQFEADATMPNTTQVVPDRPKKPKAK